MDKKNLINLMGAFSIIILTIFITLVIYAIAPQLCFSWPESYGSQGGRFSGPCGLTTL